MKLSTKYRLRLLIALITMAMGSAAWAGTKTDVLTKDIDGTSGSYTAWDDKTFESTAVYAGLTSGATSLMFKQAKQNNKYTGIITTTSGGYVRKVTVSWGTTTSGHSIRIYGKNTAYTSPDNLFSKSEQGTLIETLTAAGTSVSLTISEDYKYIGFCVNDGNYSVNLSEIQIEWEDASYDPAKTATATAFPRSSYSILFRKPFDAPVAAVTTEDSELDGAALTYTSSDPSVAEVNAATGAVNILKAGSTTITASYAGDDTYESSTANYTLNVLSEVPATWAATSLSYAENTPVEGSVTATDAPVSISFSKGSGTSTPKYHTYSSSAVTTPAILFNAYNDLTLAAPEGYAISGITINYIAGSHLFTPSIGTYKVAKRTDFDWYGTWTGCSPHVTFANTSTVPLDIVSIDLSYIKLAEANISSVTVYSYGAATICPIGQPIVVGDGTLTRIITGVDESQVIVEKNIPVVPASIGVMLHGADTYTCYTDSRLSSPNEATLNSNRLRGVTANTPSPQGSYVLQYHADEGFGFYRVEEEGIATVTAGKAYLLLDDTTPHAGTRRIFFTQDEADHAAATSVESLPVSESQIESIYNLNGMPLKAPQKGINIIRLTDGTTRKQVVP